jgi:putative LysE/RhtB family amino acid efflux pump
VGALWLGFGLGFVVGAQPGPISLFLVRSTLRRGLMTGLAIGAGIAVVDTLYAAVGAAGATSVLTIGSVQLAFGLLGAAVLVALGCRTLWTAFRVRTGGELDREVASPRRAFVLSLIATASNPLTIALWTGVFAAATVAQDDRSGIAAALLLAGVGAGSMTWFALLSGAVATLRRRLEDHLLRFVEAAAGAGLVGFGSLLGYRSVHER